MKAQHSYYNPKEILGTDVPKPKEYRRRYRQYNSQIRDQAEKSAKKSSKIEKWDVQRAKGCRADDSHKHTDQQISHHKAANHGRNQSQGGVCGMAILHGEQHHSGRANVLLPGQHEIGQKGNE